MNADSRLSRIISARLFKPLSIGLLSGVVGLVCSALPFFERLETDLGLDALFRLRGPRAPPSDVVLVSMNSWSSRRLGLAEQSGVWPRSLHARLLHRLSRQGARAIAFDMRFDKPRAARHDQAFAEALRAAGNVVLFEYLQKEAVLEPNGRYASADVSVVRRIPPMAAFADAAAAVAPFPLPQVPFKVSQVRLFEPSAGDAVTMPMAVFQHCARPHYPALIKLINKILPASMADGYLPALPGPNADTLAHAQSLRAALQTYPELGGEIQTHLDARTLDLNPEAREMLASAVEIYAGDDSQFIDFYGPPQSITTVPYHWALRADTPQSLDGEPIDFRDKVVFVGFAEQFQPEQGDDFYTVFSRADGLQLSGVEIAATTFANLLEGRKVRPPDAAGWALAIFLWGFLAGPLLAWLPGRRAVAGALGLVIAGLGVAYILFLRDGVWMPLVVPLAVQLPVALVGSLLWQRFESRRESQRLHHTLNLYLPKDAVIQLARPAADARQLGHMMFGVCVATDVAGYSALSEGLPPDALRVLLNRYFERLFEPVRVNGGQVCDIKGDAMLAVWTEGWPQQLKASACRAALDICRAVNGAGSDVDGARLPTRIGVHCGQMELGAVGSGEHFEYRPVGDIINTAARIESLSKHLGTWLLASDAAVAGLGGVATRELGCFKPAGKSMPTIIHEVLACGDGAQSASTHDGAAFEQALTTFRAGDWQGAHDAFEAYLSNHESDGPARFYLRLCSRYRRRPPKDWDGAITLREK